MLESKYKAIVKNIKSTIGPHQAFASLTILTVLLTALSVIQSHCGFVFIVSLIEISFLKTALKSLLWRATCVQHTKCVLFSIYSWLKQERDISNCFFIIILFRGPFLCYQFYPRSSLLVHSKSFDACSSQPPVSFNKSCIFLLYSVLSSRPGNRFRGIVFHLLLIRWNGRLLLLCF